jgi:hypothetical protein
LFVLLTVRLLMPPGVCICKLSSPATRMLAAALGSEAPASEPEDDNDHSPGCPASPLAAGLGVAPPSGPGKVALALNLVSVLPDLPSLDAVQAVCPADTLPPEPSGGAIYLTVCALLI